VKYTPIQVSPEESQFLATQQANVAQVARYFWIPPEMVGGSGGNSMTYANVEQRSLDFLTYAVSFWLKRIEDAMFGHPADPQCPVRHRRTAPDRRRDAGEGRRDAHRRQGLVPSEVRAEPRLASDDRGAEDRSG
jgi:phage portal protein BeeE